MSEFREAVDAALRGENPPRGVFVTVVNEGDVVAVYQSHADAEAAAKHMGWDVGYMLFGDTGISNEGHRLFQAAKDAEAKPDPFDRMHAAGWFLSALTFVESRGHWSAVLDKLGAGGTIVHAEAPTAMAAMVAAVEKIGDRP